MISHDVPPKRHLLEMYPFVFFFAGTVSLGASVEPGDAEGVRRPLHEQLQALRLQLEQSASETLR